MAGLIGREKVQSVCYEDFQTTTRPTTSTTAGPTRPLDELLSATIAQPFIPAGCPTGFIELNATMMDDKQVSLQVADDVRWIWFKFIFLGELYENS